MPVYIALLRAVNVGGTGMLAMSELAGICLELGCANVRTYIQSGNVVVSSKLGSDRLRAGLEAAVAKHTGAAVDVILRSAVEMRRALEDNPFGEAPPAKVAVLFFRGTVSASDFAGLRGPAGEEVHARQSEVYIHYPEGMGRSKLKLPQAAKRATARNINTVTKLLALAEETERSATPAKKQPTTKQSPTKPRKTRSRTSASARPTHRADAGSAEK